MRFDFTLFRSQKPKKKKERKNPQKLRKILARMWGQTYPNTLLVKDTFVEGRREIL